MAEDGDDLRRRAAALVLERAFMIAFGCCDGLPVGRKRVCREISRDMHRVELATARRRLK